MTVAIRAATADDVEHIVALNGLVQDLHGDLYPHVFKSEWNAEDFEHFWLDKFSDERNRVAIAWADGRPIGYIWMQRQCLPADAFHFERPRIYVHHICVHPDWRIRGVGRHLLSMADAFAVETNVGTILIDVWDANIVGRRAFEGAGFTSMKWTLSKLPA